LIRSRIRLLVLARTLQRRKEGLRDLRKCFIEHLNKVRDEYAKVVTAPRIT